MSKEFDDVGRFHEKFGLPFRDGSSVAPHLLDRELFEFRVTCLKEELQEFIDAHKAGDLAGAFDGLLDLTYFVLGTAHLMHLPWDAGWDEVQRANMSKIRATTGMVGPRGDAEFDVIKGPDFVPPDIAEIIRKYSGTYQVGDAVMYEDRHGFEITARTEDGRLIVSEVNQTGAINTDYSSIVEDPERQLRPA